MLTGQLASLLTYGKINTRWHAQGKDLKTLILTLIVILTFHICPGPQGELSFLYLSQGKDTFVLFYSNPPSGKSLQISIDVFVSGEYPRTCYLPEPHTFHVLPSQQCVPGPAPLAHGTRGITTPKAVTSIPRLSPAEFCGGCFQCLFQTYRPAVLSMTSYSSGSTSLLQGLLIWSHHCPPVSGT